MDASVAVKWAVAHEPLREQALALLRDTMGAGIRFIVPPLFVPEVDSVIRKQVFRGQLTPEQARKANVLLDAAPLVIVDLAGVRVRARQIAEQFNQRMVYDATYAALADLRACEFWTADEEFYKKVRSALPFVKFLGNYV